MKPLIFLITFYFSYTQAYSQFGPQQIIGNDVVKSSKVHTVDIDGDGDLDILSQGNKIAWFENLNGQGLYGNKQIIVENSDEFASSVSASDFDGDGDLDLVSIFLGEFSGVCKVAWNKNLDGKGNFGKQLIIDENLNAAFSVLSEDFDNDNDNDILVVDRNDDKLVWYENLNGLGSFSSQRIISTSLDWPIFAFIADIDNDNDIDIVSHSYDGNNIAWFENLNGQGNFSNLKIISTDVINPIKVFCEDMDMDGDLDVISVSVTDNKIAWYENTNGQGSFGPQMIITTEVIYPRTLFVKDLDNDGDNDILSSYYEDGYSGIVWCENLDNSQTFAKPSLISEDILYPTSVLASDIDQDEDFDVLSTSQQDSKIAWYENLTILGTSDIKKNTSILYPNPFSNSLSIKSTEKIDSIQIFNELGQLVKLNYSPIIISTKNLQSGIYFAHLHFKNGTLVTQKLIKD
ncbi:MAG: hypothetical protein CMC07_05285 [Flavobacteriaceae bacterium]|nr:hypothetical protein [Flavobacteriaceae bacterium]|tara:strand:- start:6199 stop:7578 length:1380 start_codon:yes stop_codon:yes gene_type:complete